MTTHASAISALTNATNSTVALATQTARQTTQDEKDEKNIAKAEAAARDFEAVFVSEMLKPMFDGLSTDGPFGGGKGEEVFRSMLLDEYGKMVAQTGTIGLADQVKQHMIMMQEQADNGS